jgi:hypothetical protein
MARVKVFWQAEKVEAKAGTRADRALAEASQFLKVVVAEVLA